MNRQKTDDYFSQAAIVSRIQQRYEDNQRFRFHIFVTLMVSLLIGFLVTLKVDVFTFNNYLNLGAIALGILEAALYSSVFWLLVAFHFYQKRSRERLAAEIDIEMNKAREYELRRYELERNSVYRLSEDGELFYDNEEEVEYDLKPKRKLKEG